MAYFLSESAPAKPDLTAKNRVWGFFGESVSEVLETRRAALEPHRENYAGPRKPASGIPLWPSRDPIEEMGGKNLYHFCFNDSLNSLDRNGLETMTLGSLWSMNLAKGSTRGLVGQAAALGLIIIGEVKIIKDLSDEISETNRHIDETNQETEKQEAENIKAALDKIDEAKLRKNPHKKPGKDKKDPCPKYCLFLCFSQARLEELKWLREYALEHPIPNDTFDHVGQLGQITTALKTVTDRIIHNKCKCAELPHGY